MSLDRILPWMFSPADTLVLERAPRLDDYLNTWFAYCQDEGIDFAPPRVKVSQESPLCSTIFWFPELGFCQASTPMPTWHLDEPFASQGDHTNSIYFWRLELLVHADHVPADMQKELASAYQHVYENSVPLSAREVYDAQFDLFLEQSLQTRPRQRDVGVLCMLDRHDMGSHFYLHYSDIKRSLLRHRCYGEGNGHHYLLSRTIMTRCSQVLARDGSMRVLT